MNCRFLDDLGNKADHPEVFGLPLYFPSIVGLTTFLERCIRTGQATTWYLHWYVPDGILNSSVCWISFFRFLPLVHSEEWGGKGRVDYHSFNLRTKSRSDGSVEWLLVNGTNSSILHGREIYGNTSSSKWGLMNNFIFSFSSLPRLPWCKSTGRWSQVVRLSPTQPWPSLAIVLLVFVPFLTMSDTIVKHTTRAFLLQD